MSVSKSILVSVQSIARTAITSDCDMLSSANLCLDDSVSLADRGDLGRAFLRAVDSIEYSCGINSSEWKQARNLLN